MRLGCERGHEAGLSGHGQCGGREARGDGIVLERLEDDGDMLD